MRTLVNRTSISLTKVIVDRANYMGEEGESFSFDNIERYNTKKINQRVERWEADLSENFRLETIEVSLGDMETNRILAVRSDVEKPEYLVDHFGDLLLPSGEHATGIHDAQECYSLRIITKPRFIS